MEYNEDEKKYILEYYLRHYNLVYEDGLLDLAVKKIAPVPREIHNFVIKLRDYVVSNKIEEIKEKDLTKFLKHAQIDDGGMMPIHKKYLEILESYDRPIGVKTLAVQLGVSEKTLEEDIEPLLLRL